MANTALNAAEAQSLWLGGVFESTLRMKCTMHRRHLASGSMGVDGGDGPGAPVTDHQSDDFQPAFDHAPDGLLPAGRVLPHALGHADDFAVALGVDADGDQDAGVLHASTP